MTEVLSETEAQTPVDPLIKLDPWLSPFKHSLLTRYNLFAKWLNDFQKNENGIENFAKGYEHMGFNVTPKGIYYREWAPNAVRAHLIGDFSILLYIYITIKNYIIIKIIAIK